MKQLDLGLRAAPSWGGARERSGRKPGPRPAVRHRPRQAFPASVPCHVTIKVRPDVPSLRSRRVVAELERSFARGCERRGFRLVHYSLQRDHAHFLVEASGRAALGRGMMSLAPRFAKAVNRVFARSGPVLRERYHLHVLRSPREVRSALRYVLLNHRKHGRGRSAHRGPDPASSGRFFDGWRRRLRRSRDRPPVASARTWLLREGWLRAGGRIGVTEVPG